jgi:hypothetical protein
MALNKLKLLWFSLFTGTPKQQSSLPLDVIEINPEAEREAKDLQVFDMIEKILKRINGKYHYETPIYTHSIEYLGSYIQIKSTFKPNSNLSITSVTHNEVDNQCNYIHDYQFIFDAQELISVSMLTSQPKFFKFRGYGLEVEMNDQGIVIDTQRRTILNFLESLMNML